MMTLKPNTTGANAAYPTATEYNRRMRQFLACLAVAGTGVAVDHGYADEPKADAKKEDEKKEWAKKFDDIFEDKDEKKGGADAAKKLVLEKVRKEIKANAEKLGDASFRVRREATKRLIAIGSVVGVPEKKVAAGRMRKEPTKPYRQLVIDEMDKLAMHTDPEVKERAKLIIQALTPKPPQLEDPGVQLGGLVIEDF